MLGWKGIRYNRVVYGYGDALGSDKPLTYKGNRVLTGKKQLPVLELGNGTLIPESGDIIEFLEDPLVYRPVTVTVTVTVGTSRQCDVTT